MNVGVMRVAVPDGKMLVQVAVLASCHPFKFMCMLMVFVVNMHMVVFQHLMLVFMDVTFGKVQPHPEPHQCGGHPECR